MIDISRGSNLGSRCPTVKNNKEKLQGQPFGVGVGIGEETIMQISKSDSWRNSGNGRKDATDFLKSLQELRDLRPQLHEAADQCESKFIRAQEKRIVLDNTKEYICRALITVVDHLGSVSSQLNCSISKTEVFFEAELRISSIKQRLLSCDLYIHKFALPTASWNVNMPRLHRRYLSAPAEVADKLQLDARAYSPRGLYQEDLPLFLYTYAPKKTLGLSSRRNSPETPLDKLDYASSVAVLPVQDGFPTPSKGFSSTFDFQQRAHKHGRAAILRKTAHNSDILSFIRRTKRIA